MVAPVRYPIVGHIPYWMIDRFGFLEACAASGEKIFELHLDQRAYLLNNHQDIEHVLAANYTNYVKNARLRDRNGKRLFGEGVQTQYGQQHRQQRRRVQPAFMRTAIATFSPQIVATVDTKLTAWQVQTELKIVPEVVQLVHCVLGKVLFGLDFNSQTDNSQTDNLQINALQAEDLKTSVEKNFGDAVLRRRQQVNEQFSLHIPLVSPLKARLKRYWSKDLGASTNAQALHYLETKTDQMIQDRLDAPQQYHDLLCTLVQLRGADGGNAMSTQQLRDEAIATSGGYETIAAVVVWTIYLLSHHPEAEAMFLAEIHEMVGNTAPTAEDILQMKYGKQLISEAMRLYPPTWIFTRTAVECDRLPSGTMLTPGTKLYLSPYLVHRNPLYFPNPTHFDPARFSKAGRQGQPDFAYFPFGGGPRVCIGQTLAETFSLLILVALFQRIRFTPVSPQFHEHSRRKRPNITLFPNQSCKMRGHFVHPA